MDNVHSKLITEAGRKILKPLGLTQKGRSRFWRDDRQWFITGVEFQSSDWSSGSYLNVGCNWLWQVRDYFAYDVGGRISSFVHFDNSEQFGVVAEAFAYKAAEEIKRYRKMFPDVRGVCDYYLQQEVENIWSNLNAGIACVLAKEHSRASQFFQKVIESNDEAPWARAVRMDAAHLKALMKDREAFRNGIFERVKQTRMLQKLPEVVDLVL